MITLYTKPYCGFCDRVLPTFENLNIPYRILDISDVSNLISFKEHGGTMTPFLIDEKNNIKMHESKEILSYLSKEYGVETVESDTEAPAVCPI